MGIPVDEKIVANSDVPVGNYKPVSRRKGLVKVEYCRNEKAPLEKKPDFKVMVSLTGAESVVGRLGLDLVTVLDVSGSMGEDDKLGKLKKAMRFLIMKLGPVDRLSVVQFCGEAIVVCGLLQTTKKSQEVIEKLVETLVAGGSTNIAAGIKKGLEVLECRIHDRERSSAIMLMSDGIEDRAGDAAKVDVGNVPVYTFGFGKDHKAQALTAITKNGGTFAVAEPLENLNHVFARCLGGLLTVVVEDLKLTVKQAQLSTLKEVSGNKRNDIFFYPQTRDGDKGSITVSFGNLYASEVRDVIVYLDLPPTSEEGTTDILFIDYSYRVPNTELPTSDRGTVAVLRTKTAVADKEKKKVRVELSRLSTTEMMYQARLLADKGMFPDAKKKLREAENNLDNCTVDSPLIDMLKDEVKMMIELMRSQDVYDKKGQSFAMSSEISHGLQRYAARGDDVDKLRFFCTPRMNEYLAQSKKFLEDPTQPVPTAEEDVKKELEKNPHASIAGPLSYYIQSVRESLKAIEDLINDSGSD